MRLVFFGTPDWSEICLERLLRSRHSVVGVVCNPDRPSGRHREPRACPVKEGAIRRGLEPILQPPTLRPRQARDRILALEPDALVVVAYGRILPGRLLDDPAFGALNVHFSLLPRHRGASPVQHAILAGDRETGVTTMLMERGLDTGPILLQSSTPIGDHETTGQLGRRLAVLGGELLVETLDGLESGLLEARPQDETLATWAPPLGKQSGWIRWNEKAVDIERKVRAFTPWPRVRARGARGEFLLLRVLVGREEGDANAAPPGKVLGLEGDALAVACGAGETLLLEQIQPAGKRPMTGAQAFSGRFFTLGETLGSLTG